jgi:hypothetical protein
MQRNPTKWVRSGPLEIWNPRPTKKEVPFIRRAGGRPPYPVFATLPPFKIKPIPPFPISDSIDRPGRPRLPSPPPTSPWSPPPPPPPLVEEEQPSTTSPCPRRHPTRPGAPPPTSPPQGIGTGIGPLRSSTTAASTLPRPPSSKNPPPPKPPPPPPRGPGPEASTSRSSSDAGNCPYVISISVHPPVPN